MDTIKCVDHYWNAGDKAWKHKDTDSKVPAEAAQPLSNAAGSSDDWKEYCFVVVRKISLADPRRNREPTITFRIVVKSPYLLTACKSVIGQIPGLSWNSEPVELDPVVLISFFSKLERYHEALSATRDGEEEHMYTALGTLLDWLRENYRTTLAKLSSLVSNGEITFDLLYGILVPNTILIARCHATGEPRAYRLLAFSRDDLRYTLSCESIEAADPQKGAPRDEDEEEDEDGDQSSAFSVSGHAFGMFQTSIYIRAFAGTQVINKLGVYPLEYHSDPAGLRAALIKRGRKWASLNGVHHVYYRGLAGRHVRDTYVRYNVNCRVMIDRGNFVRLEPNYAIPKPSAESIVFQQLTDRGSPWNHNNELGESGLTDDQLLLTSAIVYGFSLSDKFWLEYNVQHVMPIDWNPETLKGLVLPADRKTLLRSLVEAHDSKSDFDDFVRGKGQGLVINLFGPPGVGKTLSAEATSEHIRRPLYVVGSGDLGINPSTLDTALERIFDVAACWNAIVLIDEADVFLEQRSLHDMERNAMVAVFLRHLEYYRGILFLTTNRIMAFDEAFLSRIHVALHFNELTVPTKLQIWRAFIKKAGIGENDISEELVEKLAEHDVNGRQIKNACRTATSLARSRKQKLGYEHLVEALNAMEEFVAEFAAMRG